MWEDTVISNKIKRVFDTHEDPPESVFMSGITLLISIVLIVLLGMINNEISVHNYIFNYILYNILILSTIYLFSHILVNLGGMIK